MSNTGTEKNVEDMLSSVRRLVSDELPRMPRAQPPKGPAALVLTEAQRIAPPLMGHNSRRKSLENRIAELEAAVANSSDDYEPDGSEDVEQHRPDRIVFTPSRPVTRPPLRLTEVVQDAPEPAESETAEIAQTSGQTEAEESDADIQNDVEVALTEAVTQSIADMAQDALGEDPAFEQALAEAVGAVPAPEAAAVDTAESTVGPDMAAPAPTESEMRPLIAALIREELQGELGERITRNVRKLVRQEIQRALTVREIE